MSCNNEPWLEGFSAALTANEGPFCTRVPFVLDSAWSQSLRLLLCKDILLCTLQYDVADLGLFEEPALKSLCMHVFAFIHNFWQYFPAIIRCCAMHYSIVGEHIHVVFGLFLKYLDKGGAFLRELCSCFHTEVIYREWFSIDCIEVRRESEDLTDGFRWCM